MEIFVVGLKIKDGKSVNIYHHFFSNTASRLEPWALFWTVISVLIVMLIRSPGLLSAT